MKYYFTKDQSRATENNWTHNNSKAEIGNNTTIPWTSLHADRQWPPRSRNGRLVRSARSPEAALVPATRPPGGAWRKEKKGEENGGGGRRKRELESWMACPGGSEERSGRRRLTSWGVSAIAEATSERRPLPESTRPWPPSHWHSSKGCARR